MKGIINGKILFDGDDGHFHPLERHVLLFDKKIIQLAPANYFAANQVEELIDAHGLYVSPGFINTHIHGCVGADTMDEDDGTALKKMAEFQATTGVTSLLPTTMTYDMPRVCRALARIRKAMQEDDGHGAKILGAHMEGPFISEEHKGAQGAKNIAKPDFELIEEYTDVIKVMTIAPEEIPEGNDFADKCTRAGIKLSVGHTSADYETAKKAVMELGFNRFTHLFNAMSGLHHRTPGAALAGLDTWAYTELIMDNVHVSPAMQRLVFNLKGIDKLIAITDSFRACGLGEGWSELGGQRVFVKGTLGTLEDGTIAGSVATMPQVIRNLMENASIPLWQAVECATRTPAKSLGLQYSVGSFETGNAADIVLLDDDVNIKCTIRDGQVVYKNM